MTNDAWLQNLWVAMGFGLLVYMVWHGSHSERWQRAWLRLRRDRLGIISGFTIGIFLALGALESIQIPATGGGTTSILGWATSGVPDEEGFSAPLASHVLSTSKPKPLQGRHWLGTNALGQDVLVKTLRACRTALIIGGITSAIYIPLGTMLGILAGFYRRWVDDLIQYVYTVLYAIPEILLLISLLLVLPANPFAPLLKLLHLDSLAGDAAAEGGKSLGKMAIALAITGWIGLCRLIRGETMRQTERPYIAAAKALGQSNWRIITSHLLPNVMHLVLIQLVLGFSNLVLAEAMLSYLGVGSPVGTPSWGNMIDGARGELSRQPVVWWTLSSATAALFLLVLSLNLFGDALRRAFDPRRN